MLGYRMKLRPKTIRRRFVIKLCDNPSILRVLWAMEMFDMVGRGVMFDEN